MMHDWVGTALPEVPPRAQEAERTLYFVNVFTDTELSVTYKKGHAVFKTDRPPPSLSYVTWLAAKHETCV